MPQKTKKQLIDELAKAKQRLGKQLEYLEKIEEENRLLKERSEQGIVFLDSLGTITDVNARLLEILRFPREKFVGNSFWDLLSGFGMDTGAVQVSFENILSGAPEFRSSEWTIKDGRGESIVIEASFSTIKKRDEVAVIAVFVSDITERRQMEESLRRSEEKYRELFENMSSGVAVYEAVDDGNDFIFKAFNRAGERIEKLRREDVIGRRVTEVFPGVESFGLFDVFKRVWKTGTTELYPETLYRDRRIQGWRENWVLKISTGEIVAVYDDITERKLMEASLCEAKRMELMGRLASGVAHEVRNPLSAIMMLTEALCRDAGEESGYEKYLDHIRGQVDRLSRLMQDLLDLGKPVAEADMRDEDFAEICKTSVELWKQSNPGRQGDVNLELPGGEETAVVNVDSARIKQVVLNLLDNAAQHSPEGSEIIVSLPGADKAMLCLQVIDRGSGVGEDKVSMVFEPFYSTRQMGTGLGMSIVKSIVESHGGSVVLYNNDPLPGCTVEVRLPIAGGKSHDAKHSSC